VAQTPATEPEPSVEPASTEEAPQTPPEEETSEKVPEPAEEPPAAPTPGPADAAPSDFDREMLSKIVNRQAATPAAPTRTLGSPFGAPPPAGSSPVAPAEARSRASESFDHNAFIDSQSDGKVRTLDDMNGKYPIGDGEHFIYVVRNVPRTFKGVPIEGIQKPIEHAITFEEFAKTYGGGQYQLTVYGTVPGGRLDNEGRPKRRALTKPIKVVVPDPFGEAPPNPDMAAVASADEDDEEMPIIRGRHRGVASEADARIIETQLDHEATKEEREYERAERARERREAREREREEESRREMNGQQRFMEKLLDKTQEEARELRNRQPTEAANMSAMAQVIAAMKPEGPSQDEIGRLSKDLESEKRRASEELSRIREEHHREMDRLRDQHRQEMDRMRDDHDRRDRDERDRVHRQIEDIRNDCTRRMTEMASAHEARLSDERRQHDRDISHVKESGNTNQTTTQQSFEMRLEVKQQEINRLTAALDKSEKALKAEQSKTLAARVEEFSGAAEALGYSKGDGGPQGWKEMLGEAAVGLMQNAPALAANVAASMRGNNAPQPQAQMPPTASQMQPYMQQPPAFATEGVDADLSGAVEGPPPIYDGEDPLQADLVNAQTEEPPVPAGQEMVVATEGQQVSEPTPQPEMTPEQQEALDHVSQQQAMGAGGMNITDDQIHDFSKMFRSGMEEGATPEEFAEDLVTQLGPAFAGSIAREIPLERVTSVLAAGPNGQTDPLVRRDGQKFLKSVWDLVISKTA